MDKIYDSEPVTPSANTESDGVMTWEFKPDGADPGAYTTAAPEDAGTYNVRLTVAETEHYDRIEKTGTFTITPKEIRLHTLRWKIRSTTAARPSCAGTTIPRGRWWARSAATTCPW